MWHCYTTLQVLKNTHSEILRLVSHQPLGCSDAIQLSLTHQVSPPWVNLFPCPGIFLAGTSLKKYVLTARKLPQNPKPNKSTLLKNQNKWHRWHPSYHKVSSITDADMAFTHLHSLQPHVRSLTVMPNPQTLPEAVIAHPDLLQTESYNRVYNVKAHLILCRQEIEGTCLLKN